MCVVFLVVSQFDDAVRTLNNAFQLSCYKKKSSTDTELRS